MFKKINIFVIVMILGYLLVSQYLSIEVDPCDIECDNCITSEQCLECYEQCYNKK